MCQVNTITLQSTPRTWYFRLDLTNGKKYEKIILFFQNASSFVRGQQNACHVSLGIARHDGKQYRRLQFEPINLHEFFYKDGKIHGLLSENTVMSEDILLILEEHLIADIIDTYIED